MLGSSASARRRCPSADRFSAALHLDVAQVRQSLRVLRLNCQLGLEFAGSILVALLLPVEVSQPEMDIRLASAMLLPPLRTPRSPPPPGSPHPAPGPKAREPARNSGFLVSRNRNSAMASAFCSGPQVTLRQRVTEFHVVRLRFGSQFQVLRGETRTCAAAVVAHPEQGAGLEAAAVGRSQLLRTPRLPREIAWI